MKLEHALEVLIYDLRKARLGLRVSNQPRPVILDKDRHADQHRLSGMHQTLSAHPEPFRDARVSARKMEQGFVPSNPFNEKGRLEEPSLLGSLSASTRKGDDDTFGMERANLSSASSFATGIPRKGATCFVFYLPPSMTDDTLRQLFMRYGTVLNAYVADKAANRTWGFGFVDFSTAAEAQAAVAGLDKCPLEGKFLSVLSKCEEVFQGLESDQVSH